MSFLADSMSPFGPSVWTGRALQVESDDLDVIGSCASVSGPGMERCVPGRPDAQGRLGLQAMEKGVSPITVAKRGGWKDARHVFETYGHDVAADDVTEVLTGTAATQTIRKRNAVK